MITGLQTTWAEVSDMGAAVAFYRDVLGLSPEVESPYWTQFNLGNGKFALHAQIVGGDAPARGWVLGLATDDLRSLRATLAAAGAFIDGDFHATPSGMVLKFVDPDGNWIQAIQLGAKPEDVA